jgi:hypothetical protein
MKIAHPEASLDHVLLALERELIDATDEEVLAAAAELGMNPSMKGSAAFIGVKSPLVMRKAPMDDFLSDTDMTALLLAWRRAKRETPST